MLFKIKSMDPNTKSFVIAVTIQSAIICAMTVIILKDRNNK